MYSLQTVFVVIVILPILFVINWKLTLLLLVPMPLVSLTVKYFGQQVHTRFQQIQDFFAQITARAQENFTGVRVVRAYAQERAEIEAFNRLNSEYAQKNLGLVRIDALMRPLMAFLIGLGFVLIVWAGVPLAARGELTVGQFTEFNYVPLPVDLAADCESATSLICISEAPPAGNECKRSQRLSL
jgi:ATP-binding cassette subfamily B protein